MRKIKFSLRHALKGVRSESFVGYIRTFEEVLRRSRYSDYSVRTHLCVAAHIGCWREAKKVPVENLDEGLIESFVEHLESCRCPGPPRHKSPQAKVAARRFVKHLRSIEVIPLEDCTTNKASVSPLLRSFCSWMVRHRGSRPATLQHYSAVVSKLLMSLGADPKNFTAKDLRRFFFDQGKRNSTSTAQKVGTAIRMFLRYLIAEGKCSPEIVEAIPTVAFWRRASLPKYLETSDVERIVASCDVTTKSGVRDRAILLLLARLGLRSGDVARLLFSDIDWKAATIRVSGKARREALLPLPQDAGDAIITYLNSSRPATDSPYVFLQARAPVQPLANSGHPISDIVKRAMNRAGISFPFRGAHVFRHSLATKMLRQGASLHDIAGVLRHQSIETTTQYAKVDSRLLREVVQPWPEALQC